MRILTMPPWLFSRLGGWKKRTTVARVTPPRGSESQKLEGDQVREIQKIQCLYSPPSPCDFRSEDTTNQRASDSTDLL